MKVAIIGSRVITEINHDYIISHIPRNCSEIISGGAVGIDSIAETISMEINVMFRKILPDYEKYGKAAPTVRNEEIVKAADLVLAFWDCRSRGTANAINACIKHHVPFRVFRA